MRILEIDSISRFAGVFEDILHEGTSLGFTIIKAAIIFLIGRLIIKLLNRLFRRLLDKRDIELSVRSFLVSTVNVLLVILLIVSIIGALGIETTSFAALLASAGVAIGMALSGNLSNFAGGLIILLFKPFKINDYISAQGTEGTVKEIQIFHTILNTPDNKLVYIPNGSLSSGVVTNYNVECRRIEWVFCVDYGTDYAKVKAVTEATLAEDSRIQVSPAPFIALNALADSSINVIVRVWVKTPDYWDVYYDTNQAIYKAYNLQGINFPFPQLTVHHGNT
ncbi:MAG: mechanosensitive ion channel [Tannerellaceae bacterium]|jgi:small conductance mechanosensitive channel|nr:mechanosensitive ion channel [Tannerellaceae bacterium]